MFVALSGENSPARRGGFLTPLQPQNISPYQFQVFFLKTGFSVVKALTEELAMIVSHTYLMCWNVFLFLHHGIGDRVSVSMPLKIRVFRVKYIELLIKGSPEKRRLYGGVRLGRAYSSSRPTMLPECLAAPNRPPGGGRTPYPGHAGCLIHVADAIQVVEPEEKERYL